MSFRTNDYRKVSFSDSYLNMTERKQKTLARSRAQSGAHFFAEHIFPDIDEKPYSLLYSDKAKRPNTPVNILIGALITKEALQDTDEEMVEGLIFDSRLQYGLHTTSFAELPLSDRSLSEFRKRCYDYFLETNIDLTHNSMISLSSKIATLVGITGRIRRMGSMMIASNIKKLSRTDLIYRCIAKLVKQLHEMGLVDRLAEGFEHYLDPNDFNKVFYCGTQEDAV